MAYLSAGYYVARRSERAAYMSSDLIPEKVLSASRCICDFFPDDWAIEWASVTNEERSKAASTFGISSADLPTVVTWATEAFDNEFGWPDAFYTLDAARKARTRFLPDDFEVVVFGLGLHEADVENFLAAANPIQYLGFAPVGESGIFQCVSAGTSIAEGGQIAGFELLTTYNGLLTCSWLCNGLEKECANHLGIRANRVGFVETYAEASRCTEFISKPETRARPRLWLP